MCDACRAKWNAALDARQAPPPITFVQVGRPDARAMGEAALARADAHWTRVREYQDWITTTCKRNGSQDCRKES
jgi:hypothetical protein